MRWEILYLGKVKKLIPGLNAAFVDVGFEKDAFLHYTDLSPYAKSLLKFTQMAINDKTASWTLISQNLRMSRKLLKQEK